MLTIRYQTAFKKDYKRIVRRGYDVRLLEEVITILAEQRPLPEIYRDHKAPPQRGINQIPFMSRARGHRIISGGLALHYIG